MSLDDVVVLPGRPARLAAYVEYDGPLGLRVDIPGTPVRFYVGSPADDLGGGGSRELAAGRTNNNGRAEAFSEIAPHHKQVTARARVGRRDLQATARVYAWDPARVVIAVDVDETLSDTRYRGLLFADQDPSLPLDSSAEVLRRLAQSYHLVYFTGRSRFLLDKTRAWLEAHDFPDQPVVVAKGTRQMLTHAAFKRRHLARLRRTWPNLLIGIGDRRGDAVAYSENGMLAVCLAQPNEIHGPHVVHVPDWNAVARFFDENREALCSVGALHDTLAGRQAGLTLVGDVEEP